jgi:hypothetical protein
VAFAKINPYGLRSHIHPSRQFTASLGNQQEEMARGSGAGHRLASENNSAKDSGWRQ